MENETLEELLSDFADSVARVAELHNVTRGGATRPYIDIELLSADLGAANQRCHDTRRAIHVYFQFGITEGN